MSTDVYMDKCYIGSLFTLLVSTDDWKKPASPDLQLVSNLLTVFLAVETKVDSFDLQMKYFCGSGTTGNRRLWFFFF